MIACGGRSGAGRALLVAVGGWSSVLANGLERRRVHVRHLLAFRVSWGGLSGRDPVAKSGVRRECVAGWPLAGRRMAEPEVAVWKRASVAGLREAAVWKRGVWPDYVRLPSRMGE